MAIGRPKGSPNKASSIFREALDAIGFNIPEKAVELYESCEREDIKQKILDMMAKYSHPTFKPVDENGQAESEGSQALGLLSAIPSDVLIEAYRISNERKAAASKDGSSKP